MCLDIAKAMRLKFHYKLNGFLNSIRVVKDGAEIPQPSVSMQGGFRGSESSIFPGCACFLLVYSAVPSRTAIQAKQHVDGHAKRRPANFPATLRRLPHASNCRRQAIWSGAVQ